jgi:UDP-2-acetamido-2-deoxy-ribo-hexuluronate aminotransferase
MIRLFDQDTTGYDECIKKVLEHKQFINGPEVKELEEKLAKYVGVRYAIGVSSGTDALLISLMAIGIKEGDEIITTPYTWISTAEVIRLLGAKIVFCDIEKDSFNISPASIRTKITRKTVAIIPVSLFGHIYDVDEIEGLVRHASFMYGTKIQIIEDAAQSFGSIYKDNRKSCGVSDIGCTSFFPTKPLGCFGDGGMCFTNNYILAEKIRAIRNHGTIKKHDYKYLGINGRLDTLQAAILIEKFKNFENDISKRIKISEMYSTLFFRIKDVEILDTKKYCKRNVFAQYTILLRDEKMRDKFISHLSKDNIEVGIFYPKPLNLVNTITNEYEEMYFAENKAKRALSLPIYPSMKYEKLEKVLDSIKIFFNI